MCGQLGLSDAAALLVPEHILEPHLIGSAKFYFLLFSLFFRLLPFDILSCISVFVDDSFSQLALSDGLQIHRFPGTTPEVLRVAPEQSEPASCYRGREAQAISGSKRTINMNCIDIFFYMWFLEATTGATESRTAQAVPRRAAGGHALQAAVLRLQALLAIAKDHRVRVLPSHPAAHHRGQSLHNSPAAFESR